MTINRPTSPNAVAATKLNNIERFSLFVTRSGKQFDRLHVIARGKFLLTAQQARELADRLHDLADTIEVDQ